MSFKPGDRVEVNFYGWRRATFVGYRPEAECLEWRPEDDCWVDVDNDFAGSRVFPSAELRLLTGEAALSKAPPQPRLRCLEPRS